ncbi:MAG: HPr family phosphocarrier protein [Deltaproteobacteria bacterium]|nr:HPr family phosphocarrier protein [Deltaproteobacteria bacterium]
MAAPQDVSQTYKINNELGLHARAAAQFVKIASRYQSEVKVQKDSREVNGKSIMGILMLAAAKGSSIRITASGSDAEEVIKELGRLIESKFGES